MTTDFEFDFGIETRKPSNANSDTPKIDYDARREYMVANCGTADKAESTIAIISGIADLGLQSQLDAKMEWKGTPEEKQAIIDKADGQYFQTLDNGKGQMVEFKRWKVAPQRAYAVFVDVPSIMLDQGQFFGDTSGTKHPLRLLLNNDNWDKEVSKILVNKRGYTIKEKNLPVKIGGVEKNAWGMAKNHTFHKLAEAVGVLNEDGLFKPAQDMHRLIGKPILIEYQVHETTSKGKKYLNEKTSLVGQVPGMMKSMIPELDRKYLFATKFKGTQNPEVLKMLRHTVIETMKLATDFEGSDIQKALIELGRVKASDSSQNQSEQVIHRTTAPQGPRKAEPSPTPQGTDFDSFDDDIPFAPIGLQEGRMFLHMI